MKLPFKHKPIEIRAYWGEAKFVDANHVPFIANCYNYEFKTAPHHITFHVKDPTLLTSADFLYHSKWILQLVQATNPELSFSKDEVADHLMAPWLRQNFMTLHAKTAVFGEKVVVKDSWSNALNPCKHVDARFIRMALVCPSCGPVGGI